MLEQYKNSVYSLFKILLGISTGLAVGWLFTAFLQLLFDWINLDELL